MENKTVKKQKNNKALQVYKEAVRRKKEIEKAVQAGNYDELKAQNITLAKLT